MGYGTPHFRLPVLAIVNAYSGAVKHKRREREVGRQAGRHARCGAPSQFHSFLHQNAKRPSSRAGQSYECCLVLKYLTANRRGEPNYFSHEKFSLLPISLIQFWIHVDAS